VRRHRTAVPSYHYLTDAPLAQHFSILFTQAEVGRYSYIVLLNEGMSDGSLDYPYCRGSLVAPDVVLTAAVRFRFCFALSDTEFIRS
jgi:hypothetical protein